MNDYISTEYKCLKDGWYPLKDMCEKYNKDRANMSKVVSKLPDEHKELVGNVWLVRESEFVKHIQTDVMPSKSVYTDIAEAVDRLVIGLTGETDLVELTHRFNKEGVLDGDYLFKECLELAVKHRVPFPIELYKYMDGEHTLYTKCLLLTSLWNAVLNKEQ